MQDLAGAWSSLQVFFQDLKPVGVYDVVDRVSRCQVFHNAGSEFLLARGMRVFGDDVCDSVPDHLSQTARKLGDPRASSRHDVAQALRSLAKPIEVHRVSHDYPEFLSRWKLHDIDILDSGQRSER